MKHPLDDMSYLFLLFVWQYIKDAPNWELSGLAYEAKKAVAEAINKKIELGRGLGEIIKIEDI